MNSLLVIILLALNGLTLAEVDISEICNSENNGRILPHPEDCSRYIVCSLTPHAQRCEQGLHFDVKHQVCNWPEFAKCQLRSSHQPSGQDLHPRMAIDTATGQTIDPMKDFDAENVICRHFGAYFLPHPQSCSFYYLCAYGHMHMLKCGLDTMWNFRKQQCDISYKAECYTKTAQEEDEIMALSQECSSSVETTTDGLTTNAFHPTGSGHTASNTATTGDMGSSTTDIFHPTGSGHTASNTATTADMGSSTTDTFHPTGSGHTASNTATTVDMGSSTTDTFHPTGSGHTASNTATTLDMGSSTTDTFHPTGSGHTASNTATTADMASSTTDTFHPTGSGHTPSEPSTTTRPIKSSPSRPPKPTKASTPRTTTSAPLPTSSKTPSSSNSFLLVCPDKHQSYISHPKDCNKYYMCIMGMPVMTSCPSGLYWDARKKSCDLPRYVKCFQ